MATLSPATIENLRARAFRTVRLSESRSISKDRYMAMAMLSSPPTHTAAETM